MKIKVIEIEWVDSGGIDSIWEFKDCKPMKPRRLVSVGYLWESTKHHVTICQSLGPDQVGRRFTIPRGCIKRIKTLAKG
jgi:hypothetical protein